ncbi:MAG: hypothetical protein R3E89_05685 [Thiolinea sp.]
MVAGDTDGTTVRQFCGAANKRQAIVFNTNIGSAGLEPWIAGASS